MQAQVNNVPYKIQLVTGELHEYLVEKSKEFRSNIAEDLSNLDLESLNPEQRPRPRYAPLSFDDDGTILQEKVREAYEAIMQGRSWINVFEGGVRGGKDVWGLKIWSDYLMVCPEKLHLALGVSLEHAILTILHSNGFGLLYTIPNGQFVRETINGAQRGVYKFHDNMGIEKQIHFYGNAKKEDFTKFQGFTFGSVYINEALNQHINGINEAKQRTASTIFHLIIITQNPKGPAATFYKEIEEPLLFSESEVTLIESLQAIHQQTYEIMSEKFEKDRKKQQKEFKINFLEKRKVPNPNSKDAIKFLTDEEKVILFDELRRLGFQWDKRFRSIPVHEIDETLKTNKKIGNMSFKKLMLYKKIDKNPNGIYSGNDYNYFHFTVDDNLAMDDMQRHEFKSSISPGSAAYMQRVDGLRKSADGTVYDNFDRNRNVFYDSLSVFDNTDTIRGIGIDPGFNHPTGLIDFEFDLEDGIIYLCKGKLIEPKKLHVKLTNNDIFYEYLDMMRMRKHRRVPDLTIIDSAASSTVNHFEVIGDGNGFTIDITFPDKTTQEQKSKHKKKSDKTVDKATLGIGLVKEGISRGKIKVHHEATDIMDYIESYEYKEDDNDDREQVRKKNDEYVDIVKYICNTLEKEYGLTQIWAVSSKGGEANESNSIGMVFEDEREKDPERDLERAIRELQDEIGEFSIFDTSGKGFFS